MTEGSTPKAWLELIEGIALLAKHHNDSVSPFHCEHDTLTVCSDPSKFTREELARLEEIGFFAGSEYDDESFTSYRFGSA